MRHFKILKAFFYFLFIAFLVSCGGGGKLAYRIDNGKIEDLFEITLTEKRIVLKPNEMFSLPEKGIMASQKRWEWNADDTNVQYAELKKNKYPAYDITISKKGAKKYFGKILFFNSDDENKSLSRAYYQIRIDSRFFEAAKDGLIQSVSDALRPSGKKASKKAIKPTWIIWLSDAPFN
ncbi:MAG: hypothetical protein JNM14_07695 [Ferruginibacter sp.]|nr:hypothetical protein [Ferruginibacter sp.]